MPALDVGARVTGSRMSSAERIEAQAQTIVSLKFRVIELEAALRGFTQVWDTGRKFTDLSVEQIDDIREKARAALTL